tara:strand:+ start:2083 stop:2595 length:513 start_codon:yes stop_codon:yes gene_type:complete
MLLNEKQVESIRDNKVTYVKSFAILDREYDFNLMSKFLEQEPDSEVLTKTRIGNLKDVYNMVNVTNYLKEFKTFFDFLLKTFKYSLDSRDGVDLFFSFVTQLGAVHKDFEYVFIIGLKGKTIYRIYDVNNIDYEINKGDMIFIPPGVKHKVIGLTPRIIASIGYFNKRIR